MTLINRINTITKPFINNSGFRYSHRHSLTNIPTYTIPTNKIIINLLGEQKSVDTASWEIYTFAQEKSLPAANIVYDIDMLLDIIYKNYFVQFIVNRCYNMSCDKLLLLNQNIIHSDINWVPYNLYVLPEAKNRFTTCNFIQKCSLASCIIYPLLASEEIKRRDINILIDN
jgi:hypothetical protein